MNFQFYLEKLYDSEEFQKFIKENPEAFPCSGFFTIDKEGKDNKQHFDYFIPSTKKMFSFKLEDNCAILPMETIDNKIPEKLSMNYDFDFNKVEKIIEEEIQKKEIKTKIQKLLFSLQKLNGEDFLIGTIFISGMGILKINIEISEMKVTDFEKKSFFDMIKVVKKGE